MKYYFANTADFRNNKNYPKIKYYNTLQAYQLLLFVSLLFELPLVTGINAISAVKIGGIAFFWIIGMGVLIINLIKDIRTIQTINMYIVVKIVAGFIIGGMLAWYLVSLDQLQLRFPV